MQSYQRQAIPGWVQALVLALLMLGLASRVVASQPQVDPAAQAVAQHYFDALRSGDRQALLSLFAGNERTRNQAQLSDPAYSQFLSDRYRQARFEIIGGGLENGSPFVDIRIWLNPVESFQERLILRPSSDPADASLHIVARK